MSFRGRRPWCYAKSCPHRGAEKIHVFKSDWRKSCLVPCSSGGIGLILEHMSSVLHYNAAILTPGQTRLEGLHKFDMNSLHCE